MPTARTRTPRRRIRAGGEDARNLRRRSLEVLRRQHPEGHGGDGQLGAPEEHVVELSRPLLVGEQRVAEPALLRVAPVAIQDDADVAWDGLLPDLPLEMPLVEVVEKTAHDAGREATRKVTFPRCTISSFWLMIACS